MGISSKMRGSGFAKTEDEESKNEITQETVLKILENLFEEKKVSLSKEIFDRLSAE